MIRFLNFVSISALIASAVWVYTIKYETVYHAEQVKKLENRLEKERQAIVVLEAEWQFLNKPSRVQILADRHLSLKPLAASQIVRPGEIPERAAGEDQLAKKLDSLLTGALPLATAKALKPLQPQAAKPQPKKPGAARAALADPARKAAAKPAQPPKLRPPLNVPNARQ